MRKSTKKYESAKKFEKVRSKGKLGKWEWSKGSMGLNGVEWMHWGFAHWGIEDIGELGNKEIEP